MSALRAVLRVRSLLERRALAEHALAERQAVAARSAAEEAHDRLTAHRPVAGPTTASGLRGARVGALALQDDALRAGQRAVNAGRASEVAANRRVEAAVARRSVERLDERRSAMVAAQAAKRVERQLDDLAIDRWRRS